MTRPLPADNRPIERLFFRPDEAPHIFGLSKRQLYVLAADDKIRIYRLGGMSFFRVSEVTQLLEAGTK